MKIPDNPMLYDEGICTCFPPDLDLDREIDGAVPPSSAK
jgi:hypothetical protein